MNIIHLHI